MIQRGKILGRGRGLKGFSGALFDSDLRNVRGWKRRKPKDVNALRIIVMGTSTMVRMMFKQDITQSLLLNYPSPQ